MTDLLSRPFVNRMGLRPADYCGPLACLIRDVAEQHDLKPEEIAGPRKTSTIVRARHEVVWRATYVLNQSAAHIARALRYADHTTIPYALKAHERRMAEAG